MGFTQSIADPCLFVSADVIYFIYVDKVLLFYKNKLAIEELKIKIKNNGILIYKEDSVASYLDVHIDYRKDSTIYLSQN